MTLALSIYGISTSMHNDDAIVFVVDDNADVRTALKALFDSVGLKTEVFAATSAFLRRVPTQKTSCLILDVRLPGLSGIDFQAELIARRIDIPIIFITGHGDIPMTVKAMRAGAVEFLTKPIREQDLLDAVRIALDRDRTQREERVKSSELRTRFAALSPREQEVMMLVTAGLLNKQIAGQMGVSEVTVKVHRHNVMKKLGAKSLAELVRIADLLGTPRSKSERGGSDPIDV
jgi:RNA polymerase sigma factor (sigma-70 family)